jgi:probable HAF family extracellular repeat protein
MGRSYVLSILGLSILFSTASAQQYTVTDIGTLGGQFTDGNAINDSNQVTGVTNLPTVDGVSPNHPFLYSNGTMLDLGTTGGTNFAEGLALNSQGQVVGDLETGEFSTRPFLWSGGVMQELDSSEPEVSGVATAINDSGVIVGISNTAYGVTFVGDTAVPLQPLGTVPNFSPKALNTSGEMAGVCSKDGTSGYTHACRFANGAPVDLQPATEPSGASEGYGINAAGVVCGSVRKSQNGHDEAALWTGTTLKRLGRLSGTLDSHCYAMNNFQQEVGGTNVPGGIFEDQDGALWDPVNGIRDLTTLVAPSKRVLSRATAISNSGIIVAQCYPSATKLYIQHACLLKPNDVLILKKNIFALTQGDPGCIVCRNILDPEASTLPNSSVGLTAAERKRGTATVEILTEQLTELTREKRIAAAKGTLLIHQGTLARQALTQKR